MNVPNPKSPIRRAKRGGRSKNDALNGNLSMYFRELAELPLMTAEQERSRAEAIVRLEQAFWVAVLSLPTARTVVVTALTPLAHHRSHAEPTEPLDRPKADPIALDPAAFFALRARGARSDAQRRSLAVQLRQADLDREFAHAVSTAAQALLVPAAHATSKVVPIVPRQLAVWAERVLVAARQAAAARSAFVQANLRLVVSIARRFAHGRMALADLIQEGNLGLIKAVERFDHTRGFRFSTYASWWIRHAISRALADKGREVRLPVHLIDAQQRVNRALRGLTATLGRQPSTEELASATNLDVDKVEKMRGWWLEQAVSIDKPVASSGDADSRVLSEVLTAPDGEQTVQDKLCHAGELAELELVLAELRPLEADILRHRFGLTTERELTLKEIGDKYQLSRERIRQLQEQALVKMRRAFDRRAI